MSLGDDLSENWWKYGIALGIGYVAGRKKLGKKLIKKAKDFFNNEDENEEDE